MAQPQRQRPEVDEYSQAARQASQSAPSSGKRKYLRPPPGVQVFEPKVDTQYSFFVLGTTAGKHSAPRQPGDLLLVKFFGSHPQLGPNGESHLCPAVSVGKPCPQCEVHVKAMAEAKARNHGRKIPQAEWNAVNELRAKNRTLMLIHLMGGAPGNMFLWDESDFLFYKNLDGMVRTYRQYERYAHPRDGYVINVAGRSHSFSGSSGNCTMFANFVFEKLVKPMPQELIAKARKICLDDCLVETPVEQLRKLVHGMVTEAEPATLDGDPVDGTGYEQPWEEPAGDEEPTHEEPAAEDEAAAPEEEPYQEELAPEEETGKPQPGKPQPPKKPPQRR